MSRPVLLADAAKDPARVAQVRTITGAPVAADSATLNDTNFPPVTDSTNGGMINTRGFESIWLNAEMSGGTNPTVTVEMLVRDGDASNGSRWKRLLVAPATLDGTGFTEVAVYGRLVYPRISAVTGSPTSVNMLAFPGEAIPTGKRMMQG